MRGISTCPVLYADCQKACNSDILGTVWSVKLKLTRLVERDV